MHRIPDPSSALPQLNILDVLIKEEDTVLSALIVMEVQSSYCSVCIGFGWVQSFDGNSFVLKCSLCNGTGVITCQQFAESALPEQTFEVEHSAEENEPWPRCHHCDGTCYVKNCKNEDVECPLCDGMGFMSRTEFDETIELKLDAPTFTSETMEMEMELKREEFEFEKIENGMNQLGLSDHQTQFSLTRKEQLELEIVLEYNKPGWIKPAGYWSEMAKRVCAEINMEKMLTPQALNKDWNEEKEMNMRARRARKAMDEEAKWKPIRNLKTLKNKYHPY